VSQHIAPIACTPRTLDGLCDNLIVNHYRTAVNQRLAQSSVPRSPLTTTGDQAVPSMTAEELMDARAR
jgi:hypothetical protein